MTADCSACKCVRVQPSVYESEQVDKCSNGIAREGTSRQLYHLQQDQLLLSIGLTISYFEKNIVKILF